MFGTACCRRNEEDDSNTKHKTVPELHEFTGRSNFPRRRRSDRGERDSADSPRGVPAPLRSRDRDSTYSPGYLAHQHDPRPSRRELDDHPHNLASSSESKPCRVLAYTPYSPLQQDAVSFFSGSRSGSAPAPLAASAHTRASYANEGGSVRRVQQLMADESKRDFGLLSPRKSGIKDYESPPSTP